MLTPSIEDVGCDGEPAPPLPINHGDMFVDHQAPTVVKVVM